MKKRKSKAEVRRNMAAIRSTGGKTETLLRSMLHQMGFRFRKNDPRFPGKPDIVFPSERIVVFIDGDYWHGRMLHECGKSYLEQYFLEDQQAYWIQKITRNAERDKLVTRELSESGWLVLRFWESDVRSKMRDIAERIAEHVTGRRANC